MYVAVKNRNARMNQARMNFQSAEQNIRPAFLLRNAETSLLCAALAARPRINSKKDDLFARLFACLLTFIRLYLFVDYIIKQYIIMSFFDKMKKASKSVVDAGAKQMLKVSSSVSCWSHAMVIVFLPLVRVESSGSLSASSELSKGIRRTTRLAVEAL
jgi:hypothetical protein